MKYAFGDFLPDQPEHGTPGISEAVNVYPGANGYRPVGKFVAHTSALPSPCKGAAALTASTGRVVILAGTATKLYRQSDLGWVEIGSGYSTTSRWRFSQFGDLAIVSNQINNVIKVDLVTDAVANLGGSPPKMQSMAVVNNFLVGTQINGKVNRIAWSGENNAEWWTFAQRKSDYNDFADGGEITGIIGGDTGLVLQRSAVRRMSYVGGNILFRFDKISTNAGCVSVHSVAQYGDMAFWYSETGFKMWDGAQIKSIGYERVDKSFDSMYGMVNYDLISTALDAQRSTVCWSTGYKMWLYNWLLDKWSVIDVASEIITPRVNRAPNLEERDSAVGITDDTVEYPGLDSFDAVRFTAGDPVFYVFVNGAMGTFNGDNMAAHLVGRRVELIEGRDARVRRVRPMSDVTDGVSLRLDTRQRLGDAARRYDFNYVSATGEMPVRARGRFVKAYVDIAEDQPWTYFQGLDFTLEAGGRR